MKEKQEKQETQGKLKYSAPAVKKALEILELMAVSGRSYTVTEIVSKLDISTNSAFRIFKELESKGYVTKDSQDSSYDLTPKLYYIGNAIRDRVSFVKAAQQFMRNINKFTGETVVLTKFGEKYGTLVIDQLESREPIKFLSTIGVTYDSYCSAMGKAMLSSLLADELDEYLNNTNLEKKTKTTITDIDILKSEISQVRESGIAFDREENLDGLTCIASPVYSGSGKLEGAIGISGLCFRMDKAKAKKFAEFISEQAKQFSCSLGYEK